MVLQSDLVLNKVLPSPQKKLSPTWIFNVSHSAPEGHGRGRGEPSLWQSLSYCPLLLEPFWRLKSG